MAPSNGNSSYPSSLRPGKDRERTLPIGGGETGGQVVEEKEEQEEEDGKEKGGDCHITIPPIKKKKMAK